MPASTRSKKSTTVLNILALMRVRWGVRIGAALAPAATVRRAAHLFSTPAAAARRRAAAADTGGAHERTLVVDGERLAVYIWGDPASQPYVLLSHGWSSYALRFVPWIAPLRDAGYAVVAFDQIGHGRSSGARSTLPQFARCIGAVGDHFGAAAAVIGHSMGGAAAAIALSEGLRAERAVLLAAPADLGAAFERFSRFVRMPVRLRARVRGAIEDMAHVRFASLLAHRRVVYLGAPALIVHDIGDTDVPWEEGERYARYWPGARLISTTGLGHLRLLGDTGVMHFVLRFLRGECVGERVVSTPNLPYGYA